MRDLLFFDDERGSSRFHRKRRTATFEYEEDNGAQTGSPLQGTTRTAARNEMNLKNIDDSTTVYSTASACIQTGNNSFSKYQFGHFSGAYNAIFAGLWAHTAGVCGTGVTLMGAVTTTYATPKTATEAAASTNMSSAIAIGSGATVLFVATGPQTGSPGASCSTVPCYSQYLLLQLQTTTSAAPGDIATLTLTLQYNEN